MTQNMNDMQKKYVKNSLVETIGYFLGTISVSILGFIISLLYSYFYSPADYGVYSLVFSAYSLLSAVYGGWIALSLVRNIEKYRYLNQENDFWGTVYISHFFMSLIFWAAGLLIIKIANLEPIYNQLVFVLSLVYFFEYFLSITNTRFRTLGMSKAYSLNTTLNNLFKIILLLLLYYMFNIKSIIGIGLSVLLTEILQVCFLTCKHKLYVYFKIKFYNKHILKYLFIYGFPLMGISITTWILNVSDRYIIRLFWPESQVGLYSYAYSLGNALFSLLIQFIMLGAYPRIVKAWEYHGKEQAGQVISQYLKLYFYILIPACFGVTGVAKNMFIALTNERYHESFPVFIVTCLSITVLGLTQYTNKAWELNGNTKVVLMFNLMAAGINVLLNFLLVPVFGYQIAAWTTLTAYLVYLIIAFILSKKYVDINIDIRSLIKVFLSSGAMFCAVALIDKINAISTRLELVFQIVAGILVYAIFMLVLKEINIIQIKEMLRKE